MERLFQRKKVT